MWRGMAGGSVWVVAACLLAGLVVAVPSAAAPPPTAVTSSETGDPDAERAAYAARVEPVCARNTNANRRILKGVRRKAEMGYLRVADRQFRRAARAFEKAMRQIRRVPRPPEDEALLERWFKILDRQPRLLRRIGSALLQTRPFQADRLAVRLDQAANRANSTVALFDFTSCILNPRQFL